MKSEAEIRELLSDVELLMHTRGNPPEAVYAMRQMLRYVLDEPASEDDSSLGTLRAEAIQAVRNAAAAIRTREKAQRQ